MGIQFVSCSTWATSIRSLS